MWQDADRQCPDSGYRHNCWKMLSVRIWIITRVGRPLSLVALGCRLWLFILPYRGIIRLPVNLPRVNDNVPG